MEREDLLGKVAIVTGANTGIGKEIARGLALKRATVVVAARNPEKGKAAAEEISDDTANPNVTFRQVDLSSQKSIRAFAEATPEVNILVNNAGAWLAERQESVDGIELTFATNVLGYHLLTRLLLPKLEASAPSRIVNVASTYAMGLDFDDLEFKKRPYGDGRAAYGQSKQANRMLSWALADRLRGKGVTVNVMHPGMVNSEFPRNQKGIFGSLARLWFKIKGISVQRGADTAVWLASASHLKDDTGGFYIQRKEKRCRFRDEEAYERLWKICEEMTK